MSKEKISVQTAITPSAKRSIDEIVDRYGMTQIEVVSRIYVWFSKQSEVIQAAILGQLPASVAPDVARMVLEQIASPVGAPKGNSVTSALVRELDQVVDEHLGGKGVLRTSGLPAPGQSAGAAGSRTEGRNRQKT